MIYKEILYYGPLYKTAVSATSHATVFLINYTDLALFEFLAQQ